MQGPVRTLSVARGNVDIRVGYKARVVALGIGMIQHHLSSRFLTELNNCYSVLVLTRNIIYASCFFFEY
jgi:hypothetical protein